MNNNTLDTLDIAYYEHVVIPALEAKYPTHTWRYEHPNIIWKDANRITLSELSSSYLQALHNTLASIK